MEDAEHKPNQSEIVGSIKAAETSAAVLTVYLRGRTDGKIDSITEVQLTVAKRYADLGETNRAREFTLLAEWNAIADRQSHFAQELSSAPRQLDQVLHRHLGSVSEFLGKAERAGVNFTDSLEAVVTRGSSRFSSVIDEGLKQVERLIYKHQAAFEHVARSIRTGGETMLEAANRMRRM